MSGVAVHPPGFLRSLWAVVRNDLRVLFLSPLAWVFISAFLLLAGMFFYVSIVATQEASLRAMMGNLAVALLFFLPMVTMRQLAEETRSGTLELVLTAPVPLWSLILGKWLATMVMCTVLLGLTGVFPLILWMYGNPDPGALVTTYLGLFACCSAFSAAGLFTSSLTRDQMVAGVGGIILLLPFWLVGSAKQMLPELLQPLADSFSLLEHLRSFARGVVDTGDVAWFMGFTFVFLFATWRAMEARRWA